MVVHTCVRLFIEGVCAYECEIVHGGGCMYVCGTIYRDYM